jgi:(p)ppGpp synthase/HD superfamily hydrolase
MPDTRSTLIAFLQEIGAGATAHSGRSLIDHLIGTYDILKKWKCDEEICIAGGLHSIYGTNVFTKESLSKKDRPMVRHLFGNAERLAWLFGNINRPQAIERGVGIKRKSGNRIILSTRDCFSLRLIEAANLIEQGSSLDGWPNIKAVAEKQYR